MTKIIGQLRSSCIDPRKSKFSLDPRKSKFSLIFVYFFQCWWQLNPLLLIQLQYTKLPKPNSHFLTPRLQLKCNQPLVRSQWYPQVARHQVQTQLLTQSSQMTPTRLYLVSKNHSIFSLFSNINHLGCLTWKNVRNNHGILLPKLFWPTVSKKCSSDREKPLKFEAEGREFANFLAFQLEFQVEKNYGI